MASSRNSAPADPVATVRAAIDDAWAGDVPPGASIAVALSGGVDSMVLLDALVPMARARGSALSAVHVNHGISRHAGRWSAFCAEQCAARGIELATRSLALGCRHGANLEARARNARYAVLRETRADVVALAHHANDQAETVLLQLLRGAGPRGLASMPRHAPGSPAFWRPLLGLPRSCLAAYAAARDIAWIDDESNDDVRYKRNLLRHDIAPRLAAHFPGYPATLARAAEHQAEAGDLLDALAAEDAHGARVDGGLACARLAALAPARARNLLRWFLHEHGLRPPSAARLTDMLRQLSAARPDARTRLTHDGMEIGCHRGLIVVHTPSLPAFVRSWNGEAEVALPGGTLAFARAEGAGLSAAALATAPVTVRSRCGGERLQVAANRPRRAVKKMLQDAAVAPWLRDALPMVWCGDRLAAVAGIGVDLAFQAGTGDAGWMIDWRPRLPGGPSAPGDRTID